MKVKFTRSQVDHICYQIGDWYLIMKPLLEGQHNLGFMKEKLKDMICGTEYPPADDELNCQNHEHEEMISFIGDLTLLIGIIQGGLTAILESPEEEMRGKLNDLWHKLNKDISSLYSKKSVSAKKQP